MTKLDALKELLAKVYAGDRPAREPDDIEDDCPVPARLMLSAFDGSRDAAEMLRKAVLPHDYIMSSDSTGFAHLWRDEYEKTHSWKALIAGRQARAESAVIIKALIAMETDQ